MIFLSFFFWLALCLQGKKDLVAIDSTEYDEENGNFIDSDDDNEEFHDTQEESMSDGDSDEERQRF